MLLTRDQPPRAVHSLQAMRLSQSAWQQKASSQPALCGLAWGWDGAGASTPADLAGLCGLASLAKPLLGATTPWVDAWAGGGTALRLCHSGAAHWQTDVDWAFGQLHLPEAAGALDATAYRDLFAALQDCACPQVLRLWNYLPRINADGGGLERYRQFDIGPQQAFIDAGRDAFEGAPAACALGTVGDAAGGLSLCFLAGRVAPRPVDNPRHVPAYRYTSRYEPRAPRFSRAALADTGGGRVALLVSGTSSIVGEHTVHLGDVVAQTHETLRNLRAVIDSAHRACNASLTLADLQPTVYLRHAADHAKVLDLLAQAVPAWQASPCVQVEICRDGILVAIEAHAVAPGTLA